MRKKKTTKYSKKNSVFTPHNCLYDFFVKRVWTGWSPLLYFILTKKNRFGEWPPSHFYFFSFQLLLLTLKLMTLLFVLFKTLFSVFFFFSVFFLSLFWPSLQCRCLEAIVEHLLPRDYFSKTLIASQADQRVLRDLLADKLPRLSVHFDALKYVSNVVVYSPYWLSFISCYVSSENSVLHQDNIRKLSLFSG